MKEKMKKYLPVYICWILATIGLIWQVYQVSEIFFTFSTRVDIEMDAPLTLIMPSITICLPLNPSLTTLKSLLNFNSNWTNDKLRSEIKHLPIKVLSNLETIDAKVFCRTKYPRVIPDSPNGQPCDLFGTTISHIQYNIDQKVINRCTTYLHQNQHEPPLTVIANEAKDFYSVEVYSPQSNVLYVYVHNPSEIINLPESDFFVIFTNQSSEIVVVSSRLTVNLPRDTFASKCFDYSDLNFGRMSCIFNCRLASAKKICNAWSTEVPAPLDVELAFRSRDRQCPNFKEYNCTNFNVCPVQCKSVWYTTSLVWNHVKEKPSNWTKFFVRRPYGLEFVYNVTPYLAPVEYSCYMASCLGIWFGISFSDIMLQIFGPSKKIKSITRNQNQTKLATIKISPRPKINSHLNGYKKQTFSHHDLNCYDLRSSNQINQRKFFPSTYLF